ncbi:UDP-N-acetylmuramoyl-L-alanyl-D-glutamate--2,6-diaminopimelate ligase [Nocardioides sp. CFH 31398]|uniref:UDP-N-acetylmuramoyl-L-alanyl-D-glutamate--2, 6-diaminopimelate ligase n=1 Tax=Nocardioides sp. CFH 31398 TaxID=2919579 RepID=UPI001F057436|nr:UDP-N-acetylmuramoyl-L-alanyl-D-glutamate--2,6-diaminopimelate ligase [Nocardioides sp. CFH 31398]MCH1868274.1 UDP-N-acetylmuramoyl-L-alanyl-D-glutamate--2,6-diaminopimelate ligase [Nocardioides sp. CFH 31398]
MVEEDKVEALRATRPRHREPVALTDLADALRAHVDAVEVVRAGADDAGDVRVGGLTLATSRVLPGDLYAALPGARAHGADYTQQALAAGAVAVLTDPEGARRARGATDDAGVPVVVVDDPRRHLGRLAALVYGDPAGRLRLVAVTGTQGKTTTTRLALSALEAAGVRAAAVGTVGTRVAGRDLPTKLTTPEAPDLFALFALMVEEGVEVCLMEVSSHALVLGRVDGVVFDVACFTNLGRDHLDFHPTVEDYYRAKASLFTPERARRALVTADDAHGRRLAGETTLPVRTFSGIGTAADWRAVDVRSDAAGSTFVLEGPDGLRLETGVGLPGAFNVANAVAALAALGEAGLDVAGPAGVMATAGGVPGRLELVSTPDDDLTVVVDYAHKPDAVEAALAAMRTLTPGRLVTVIGAGGDRDPGKRPLMGAVAARLSDVVVVTDDNPRSEDPAAIRAAVLGGARDEGADAVLEEVADRREAVRRALALAGPGGVVVVAGKGHEAGQEVAGVVHAFDDRAVAAEELAARATGRRGAAARESTGAAR